MASQNTVRYKRTPVDCLGYDYKCCHCIPMRAGSIIICIISFLWSVVELTQLEKFMDSIFQEKNTVRKVFLIIMTCVIFGFLVTSGVLMIGLIVRRSMPLHIYVWSAFIYNCFCICMAIVSCSMIVIRTGTLDKKSSMKLAAGVVWYTLFFYFISVVNSYKMTMWM